MPLQICTIDCPPTEMPDNVRYALDFIDQNGQPVEIHMGTRTMQRLCALVVDHMREQPAPPLIDSCARYLLADYEPGWGEEGEPDVRAAY